jgi:hypothetical protein
MKTQLPAQAGRNKIKQSSESRRDVIIIEKCKIKTKSRRDGIIKNLIQFHPFRVCYIIL